MKNRNRPKAGSIGVLDGAAVVAVMAAGLIINVVSGGIRNNVGIIIDPISVRTGLAYADVSFALALLLAADFAPGLFWVDSPVIDSA